MSAEILKSNIAECAILLFKGQMESKLEEFCSQEKRADFYLSASE